MSFMQIDLTSRYVGRTNVAVFYPTKAPSAEAKHGHPGAKPRPVIRLRPGEKYQALWLLHGSGGDFRHWLLNSMLMELAEKQQLAVVMPTVKDFIGGQPDLGDYFRYVSEELPVLVRNILPISMAQEDNFICGLSYGGYLAWRVALTHPQTFSCAGSLSSPIDVLADIRDKHLGQYGYPLPEQVADTDRDLIHLVRKAVSEQTELPDLFQACGTEDFTWEYNTAARDAVRALGVKTAWVEFPGVHNFDFWNVAVRRFMDWLPLRGAPVEGKE